jgi:prepilin-type N-terminal cleavage/methylation domain-containing protein
MNQVGNPSGHSSPGRTSGKPRGGFTLVELIVVIVIISIIIAFILTAAMGGIRTAEEKATQSLIAKLDAALTDRLEALMESRPDPDAPHQYLAWVYSGGDFNAAKPVSNRAFVIAMTDYIKRELPDVFYVDPNQLTGPYPLNFAANPYLPANPNGAADFVLPLGTGTLSVLAQTPLLNTGEGIYGASYAAAAGVYKNLGYNPIGYDGVNNDIQNDLYVELVSSNLSSHTHITARSEMLYAMLVEGNGPFGSAFVRDDFTDKEVRDTDGDGLPEFVDAWGQPLQFYRWPTLYHSDLQRGQQHSNGVYLPPYFDPTQPLYSATQEREQDPLDPNQTLVSPNWWASEYNSPSGVPSTVFPAGFSTGPGASSQNVSAFEYFFHSLHDPPVTPVSGAGPGQFWDRSAPNSSGFAARRAFYTRFLIVSSGPDKQLGIFQYADTPTLIAAAQSAGVSPATLLIQNENPAPQFDPTTYPVVSSSTLQLKDNGQDDISNHALQAGGGGSAAP